MKRACSAPSAVENGYVRVQWDNYADGHHHDFRGYDNRRNRSERDHQRWQRRARFSVLSGIQLNLNKLTIAQGKVFGFGYGGGIFNQGTLTVTNSTFEGNSAFTGAASLTLER